MMKLFNADFYVQNLHVHQDAETGMIAIVALHNLKNGPALGGCRFVSYDTVDAAIKDAMQLARAMTYKSAMAGLPLGGGKAVIIHRPQLFDSPAARRKLFEAFGDFVNTLNGKYITASDSGSTEEDMRIIATRTRYVTSINKRNDITDDTAAMTAAGMVKALEAAVKYRFQKDSLNGVHIAIQGLGSVGFKLGKLLVDKGVRLTVTDKNKRLMESCAQELAATMVEPDKIAQVECDVFSPCALGGVINEITIQEMKAPVICGAANNQMQDDRHIELMNKKNIIYVPDYVANAGGVICAAAQAGVITKEESYTKVKDIFYSVLEVLKTSAESAVPTHLIANTIAEKRFS